ncbi:hypothetical protein D3C86_1744680 [compost metagenome]
MKHLALNDHQRWHFLVENQFFVFQLVVNPRQLHGVQRRNDQRSVREQRQADMHHHARCGFKMGDEFVGNEGGKRQVNQRKSVDNRQ